jgi:hypothetical protein
MRKQTVEDLRYYSIASVKSIELSYDASTRISKALSRDILTGVWAFSASWVLRRMMRAMVRYA